VSRALGLDLGSVRIGVAVAAGAVATPLHTIIRSGDRAADHAAIGALVDEWEATVVVVGLPLLLSGSEGPAASAVREEVAQLRATLPVPVETYDERLTTVSARRSLRESGVEGRRRRKMVDQVAAAVMLQAWLDRASSPDPASDPDLP
jgi:putative Holliday junction resolvase